MAHFRTNISVLGLKMPERGAYDPPLNLVLRLRISGAKQPLLHTPLWRAESQLSFYLTAVCHIHVSGTFFMCNHFVQRYITFAIESVV